MPDRTFTVQGSDFGVTGGVYKSSTPAAAAKKASRILFKSAKTGVKSIKFILRETTHDSKKKTYFYEAFINYLNEPKVINRSGVDITITKEIRIKTCGEHHMSSPSPMSPSA